MRLLAVLMIPALISGQAFGQESQIVQACLATAGHFMMIPVEARTVQDFSDLIPPRARIDISPTEKVTLDVRCTFSAASTPLGLTEFCFMNRCLSEQRERQRFDELRVLLERDGF